MSDPKDKIPTSLPSGGGEGKGFSRTDEPLDADLRDLSRAYRDAPGAEPPQALDDAIRAAARRAVRAKPQPLRKSWISRWTGPVATAALVVLTVSISFLSVDEKPEMVPPPVQQVMKPRTAVPTEVQEEAVKEEIPASPSLQQAGGEGSSAKENGEAARPAAPRKGATLAAPKPADAATAPRQLEKKVAPAAREPSPFVADPTSRPAAKTEALPAAPAAPAAEAPHQPATVMKPKAAQPAPARESADTASGSIRPEAPAFTTDAPSNVSRVSPQMSESRTTERSQKEAASAEAPETPDAWLRRILQLRRDGKEKEAEEELAKFKRRYPDYPLPAELRSDR